MVLKKQLVKVLKNYLEKKGYAVKIEPQTSEYAGHKADLEAEKGNEKLCFEIINGKNVDTPAIKEKLQAISGNKECDFGIFTTNEREDEIKKLMDDWKVEYRLIWRYAPDTLD